MSLLLGVAVAVVFGAGPEDPAFAEQMREAIRRHDGGDYAGAITLYRSLLKQHPHDANVVYELSYSMQESKAPPAELIALAEAELRSKTPQLPQLYATLATAYDTSGDLAKGEATLRRGLQVGPKSVDLHFNLGINLMMQHRPQEAEAPLKTAVQLKPEWPSAWRALAAVLEENGKITDAFVSKCRFVALEPNTPRGKQAAQKLWPMLMAGAEQKKAADGGTQIDIVMRNHEDLMLNMRAALRYGDKATDGEFFVSSLTELVAYTEEVKDRPFLREAASLFLEAREAGVLEPMAWEIRLAAGDAQANTWLSKHRKQTDALERFLNTPAAGH